MLRANARADRPGQRVGQHLDARDRLLRQRDRQAALERLPRLIEGVLGEDFKPNPEADCTWCKFKPLCPLWSEGKELPA